MQQPDGILDSITVSLKELTVQVASPSIESSKTERDRRALQTKDANAVAKPRLPLVKSKTGQTKCTTKAQIQEHGDCKHGEDQAGPHPAAMDTASPMRRLSIRPKKADSLIENTVPVLVHSKPALLQSEPWRHAPTHIRPLLRLATDPQEQAGPIPFADWTTRLESDFYITKIAEASYSEVYRLLRKVPLSSIPHLNEVVLKVIQLRPERPKDKKRYNKTQLRRIQNDMTDISRVVTEVEIMQRMADIPGFTDIRGMRVLQGRPAGRFIDACSDWNATQPEDKQSYFPDPTKRNSYPEDQLWCAIEMGHAGISLEDLQVEDIWHAWDIFWGVALALGKAEQEAQYEHRDLHLGNVCIHHPSLNSSSRNLHVPDHMRSNIKVNRKYRFTPLQATIIDCTLSRASMEDIGPTTGDQRIAYANLEKELWLFKQSGTEHVQYDYYRYMRAATFFSDPFADTQSASAKKKIAASTRTWQGYHPQTNLVWLQYILQHLVDGLRAPRAGRLDSEDWLHDQESSDKITHRAAQLESALLETNELITLANLPVCGIGSVSELVVWALQKGFLDQEDVVGSAEVSDIDIAYGSEEATPTLRRSARL